MREISRSEAQFKEILQISNESFTGIERPNAEMLRYQYQNCDLFIRTTVDHHVIAYAIVTSDGTGQPYIWSIVTDLKYRNFGFASGLLKEIVKWCTEKHDSVLTLTVHVNNPAQKLYFDQGFRVVRVLPRFYGEDGLRMRRVL